MNVVFTEEEMKKFLVEATRVSQVPIFALLLLLRFVPAVSFSAALFSTCFRGASEIRVWPLSSFPKGQILNAGTFASFCYDI